MKVSLYGHLIVDHIFTNFKETITLGGIANVWFSLLKMSGELEVELIPCAFGEAIVYVNTYTGKICEKAVFDTLTQTPVLTKSDWHHIAYLNQLNNPNFIEKIDSGFISADVTKESPELIMPYLKYIDYLFISEEDLFDDIHSLAEQTKGWVIAHSPLGSQVCNGDYYFRYTLPEEYILENPIALGAGDTLAASFITCILNDYDIKNAITLSHLRTSRYLEEKII